MARSDKSIPVDELVSAIEPIARELCAFFHVDPDGFLPGLTRYRNWQAVGERTLNSISAHVRMSDDVSLTLEAVEFLIGNPSIRELQ